MDLTVKLGQYKGIEVEKIPVEVTEEEVQVELVRLQEENVKEIQVTDRAVENGDIVNLDYCGKKDGVAFDGGTADGQTLVIGSHTFIEGFEEQLIGHQIGETFDINVAFPEQYPVPELAGQPVVFTIKLNGIKVTEQYDLDDTFAKEVFLMGTLEDLKNALKAELIAAREAEAATMQENEAVDKVIANAEMEIPQEMISEEADRMVKEMGMRLQSQGMSMEMYLNIMGMTEEALKENIRPQAEKSILTRFVLDEIAKVEDIQVTEEEMDREYAKFAAMYQVSVEDVKTALSNNMEGLKKEIAAQKAIDLIIREAKF